MTRYRKASDLTRREVLATFLGLPVALSACRSRPDIELPPGDIVGASDVLGHRIRDGLRVSPASDQWESKEVVIVGGGVAGLAAAYRLQKRGVEDFVVMELEREPGGTSRSGSSPLTGYPWGAHYLPAPMKENRDLVVLLDEMGMVEGHDRDGEPIFGEQFLCRDPEERTFLHGRWYEGLYMTAGTTSEDAAQWDRFNAEINRWVAWRDGRGRRAFTIPVANASDDQEVTQLDRISMSDWLQRNRFTSRPLRWLIDYSCRDDYGLTADQASAWAGLFYFASRVKKPGAESEPLLTWPEGNGHLAGYLYRKCKAKVRLGLAACEIIPDARRNGIDVVAVDHEGTQAYGFHAKRVIFAAPQFLTRYVIRDYRDKPPDHVGEFQYGAWMVANLFLKDRPAEKGFPLAWDNVLYDSESLGYVVATHQRGLDRGPTVFTYYYPLCDPDPREARRRLLETGRDQWADVALADLGRAHPEIRSLAERLDVMRWGHAMIRPRPGFVWGEARRKGAIPYRGIHFANTDLGGVALFEEAFFHGLRAADEVLAIMHSGRADV
jgi:glycine/D-amino acid oxidase-like deaminating enzyme